MADVFALVAPLWRYDGPAPWYFVSLPQDVSDEIRAGYGGMAGGFGSLRVEVTVGRTTWRTSVFPQGRSGRYLLPVKRQVRRDEGLEAGDEVALLLRVL
ncbi:MAG TPA: DUF1905 domain-containing protein [Trueperaceae bacterium]|nr:DUF1905 domain-containing protein [Trueperaceae bacterium]